MQSLEKVEELPEEQHSHVRLACYTFWVSSKHLTTMQSMVMLKCLLNVDLINSTFQHDRDKFLFALTGTSMCNHLIVIKVK